MAMTHEQALVTPSVSDVAWAMASGQIMGASIDEVARAVVQMFAPSLAAAYAAGAQAMRTRDIKLVCGACRVGKGKRRTPEGTWVHYDNFAAWQRACEAAAIHEEAFMAEHFPSRALPTEPA